MQRNGSNDYTEGALFVKAIADFLTTKFLVLSTAPFFITLVISIVFLYYLSGEFFDILNTVAQISQNPDTAAAQNELSQFAKEYPIISAILGSFIFKTVAGTLFYVIGGGFAILVSILFAVVIIGFFTPYIVAQIQRRHYPNIERKATVPIFDYIIFVLGRLALFLLFFFVSLPFYFIPLFNIVAMNAPFYFLFHTLLTKDVAGEILDKQEQKEFFKRAKWRVMATTFILYLFSLIPAVGIFGQVFFVIVLAHQFFLEAAQLRNVQIKSTTA